MASYSISKIRVGFSQGQFNKPTGSSSISVDEAYKLLGLKRGCAKEEVLRAAKKLQQKIHPDMNQEIKTERLSQLVNEATDKIIKSDFLVNLEVLLTYHKLLEMKFYLFQEYHELFLL